VALEFASFGTAGDTSGFVAEVEDRYNCVTASLEHSRCCTFLIIRALEYSIIVHFIFRDVKKSSPPT
jgi:hypothetical protein